MKNSVSKRGPRVQPWDAVQRSRSLWSRGLLKVNNQTGVGEALLLSATVHAKWLWKPVTQVKRWHVCLV